jgi:ribosomal protein S27E
VFGWFKKQESNTQERQRQITLVYFALENGLKGVENHWAVGNTQVGDKLFEPIFNACLVNFVEYSSDPTPSIHEAQFDGLKSIFAFLIKHDKQDYLNKLVVSLPPYMKNFEPRELQQLMHAVTLAKESIQSKKGESEYRLVYYMCQCCGRLNLMSTAPCFYCGFSAKSEQTFRRSLLLCSNLLHTPILLRLAANLQFGLQQSPPKTIEEIWIDGDLDQAARQQTSIHDAYIPELIQTSVKNAESFAGTPNFSIKCPECTNTQLITYDSDPMQCQYCNANIAIPYFRSFKATLVLVLDGITLYADHKQDISYANFIGTYVLIADYAMRRDTVPTQMQRRNLVERFLVNMPLSYFSGSAQINFENGKPVVSLAPKLECNTEAKAAFIEHALAVQRLLEMLASNELQA